MGHTGRCADRQRGHLHRQTTRRRPHRPGDHPGRTGHQIQPLAALPSADLRQSRAFPPNPEKTPAGATRAATIAELQHQIDEFLAYYNNVRPHRALHRRTPIQAFNDRPKAFPSGYQIPPHYRVRHDTIDAAGVITIRHNSRLHHIGLSKRRRGTKVTVLIDDLDIRVLHHDTGALIRKLILDPTRDYQPRGVKCGNSPENRLPM